MPTGGDTTKRQKPDTEIILPLHSADGFAMVRMFTQDNTIGSKSNFHLLRVM